MKKTIAFYFLLCLPSLLFYELQSMQETPEELKAQIENFKKELQEKYIIKLDALIKDLKKAWNKTAKKITGKTTIKEINTISADEFKKYLPQIKNETENEKQRLSKVFFNNLPISTFNIQNENGKTILHIMIHEGYPNYVKYLLDNEGDITIVNKNKNSSLHLAANNIDITNLLLKKASTLQFPLNFINQQNIFGNTALILAVENNNTAVVQALLKAGADPNIINNDGFTALHQAILQEHQSKKTKEIITILLEYGADPDIITTSQLISGKTRQNKSPRELAEKIIENNEILNTIRNYPSPRRPKSVTIPTQKRNIRFSTKPSTIRLIPSRKQEKEKNKAYLIQDLQELTQKLHVLTSKLSA